MSQVLPDDPRLRSLEVFLDRGFEFRAEDRFQTCGELVDRLAKLAIVLQASTEDPNQVAARLAAELVVKDRNTQIHLIREKTQGLRGHFQTFSTKLKILPFQLLLGGAVTSPQLPSDYDPILMLSVMSVQVQSNPGMTIGLSFAVGAKGQECSLFRFIQLANFPNQNPTVMPHCGVWEALTTFNPNKLPSETELMPLLQDSINIAMTALQKQILARVPTN
jgi:hypothetical protein